MSQKRKRNFTEEGSQKLGCFSKIGKEDTMARSEKKFKRKKGNVIKKKHSCKIREKIKTRERGKTQMESLKYEIR